MAYVDYQRNKARRKSCRKTLVRVITYSQKPTALNPESLCLGAILYGRFSDSFSLHSTDFSMPSRVAYHLYTQWLWLLVGLLITKS